MGLRINANIPALNANRETSKTTSLLSKTLQQLASGRRINQAADDAAGLASAENLNTRGRQAQVESGNLQTGYNAAQTAAGGVESQSQAIQRIRELAVQASNGLLSEDQRGAINAEAQQLVQQIGDVASNTQFNGQNLLDQNQTISLGTEGGAQLVLNASTPAALGVSNLDLSTASGAANALNSLDTASARTNENQASLGAQMNGYESAIIQRGVAGQNAADAESRIRDLDVAQASIERSRGQILQQGGLAALLQSNVTPQSALRLLNS
jgi:flagellin